MRADDSIAILGRCTACPCPPPHSVILALHGQSVHKDLAEPYRGLGRVLAKSSKRLGKVAAES